MWLLVHDRFGSILDIRHTLAERLLLSGKRSPDVRFVATPDPCSTPHRDHCPTCSFLDSSTRRDATDRAAQCRARISRTASSSGKRIGFTVTFPPMPWLMPRRKLPAPTRHHFLPGCYNPTIRECQPDYFVIEPARIYALASCLNSLERESPHANRRQSD